MAECPSAACDRHAKEMDTQSDTDGPYFDPSLTLDQKIAVICDNTAQDDEWYEPLKEAMILLRNIREQKPTGYFTRIKHKGVEIIEQVASIYRDKAGVFPLYVRLDSVGDIRENRKQGAHDQQ